MFSLVWKGFYFFFCFTPFIHEDRLVFGWPAWPGRCPLPLTTLKGPIMPLSHSRWQILPLLIRHQCCRLPCFFCSNQRLKVILNLSLKIFFLFNDVPNQDQFVLWNAHNAFARGILIQIGARARRQCQSKVKNLTEEIVKFRVGEQTTSILSCI